MKTLIPFVTALLALTSHAHVTAQLQSLPSSCPVTQLRGGTPSGPVLVGGTLGLVWAGPNSICQPPPGSQQVLLLGRHQLRAYDFGGPCRNAICTVVDVAPVVILPPNRTSGAAGWVVPVPPDPSLRGAVVDTQVVASTCVSFLPGLSCVGTSRPVRVTIQ